MVCAIPQWAYSGEPILTQIKAFDQTLTTAKKVEPISESTKYQYTENIKTMMQRMNKTNLDFLVTDIPGVIEYLNKTDTTTESRIAYNTRLSSRNFFTVATVFLPLARTNDPNDRTIAIQFMVRSTSFY